MFIAIYWRHRILRDKTFDTMKEAREYLEAGEDYGNLSSTGIIDPLGVFHMVNSLYGKDEINECLKKLNLDNSVCAFISDPLW
jgi:hypothetical protein